MEIPFTNREIAIAILITAFTVWAIRIPGVRDSLKTLIKAALAPKLVLPVVLVGLWIWLGVFSLERIGFWDQSLLKETILWSLLSGLVLLFDAALSKDPNRNFEENFGKQFKWAVVVSFFINLVSFPLLVEIPFLAVLILTALCLEVAKMDEKNQAAVKPLEWILGFFGWVWRAPQKLSHLL